MREDRWRLPLTRWRRSAPSTAVAVGSSSTTCLPAPLSSGRTATGRSSGTCGESKTSRPNAGTPKRPSLAVWRVRKPIGCSHPGSAHSALGVTSLAPVQRGRVPFPPSNRGRACRIAELSRYSVVAAVGRGLPDEINFEPYVFATEGRLGPAPAGCEMIDELQPTSTLHGGPVLALVRRALGIAVVDLHPDTGQDVPGDHCQRGLAV